jgi:hypothetical protein
MPRDYSPAAHALHLAELGWHVFPLAANKRPLANCPACKNQSGTQPHPFEQCPCLVAGGWCHGVRAATRNPRRIHRWWIEHPDAVVAVATGPSNLVLIDIDSHRAIPPADLARTLLPGIDLAVEPIDPAAWQNRYAFRDGRDSLRLLAQLRGGPHPWPADTRQQPVTADTPSGGRHLWYRAPATNLRQALDPYGLAWQVDLKAGWSYGIAPGAQTMDRHYRHDGGDLAEPGTLPPWLVREILRVGGPRPTSVPTRPSLASQGSRSARAAYLNAVIRNGAAELATLTDGRKQALSALAYKVGGYLTWADQAESAVIDQLIAAGTASGLNHHDAARIATRALANGRSHPLSPQPNTNRASKGF